MLRGRQGAAQVRRGQGGGGARREPPALPLLGPARQAWRGRAWLIDVYYHKTKVVDAKLSNDGESACNEMSFDGTDYEGYRVRVKYEY